MITKTWKAKETRRIGWKKVQRERYIQGLINKSIMSVVYNPDTGGAPVQTNKMRLIVDPYLANINSGSDPRRKLFLKATEVHKDKRLCLVRSNNWRIQLWWLQHPSHLSEQLEKIYIQFFFKFCLFVYYDRDSIFVFRIDSLVLCIRLYQILSEWTQTPYIHPVVPEIAKWT